MKKIKKYVPIILAIGGCVGTVTTTVLAIKATPKAMKILDEKKKENQEDLTIKEKIKYCYKPYLPAIISCILTCGCIIGSEKIMINREKNLLNAYLLLNNGYNNYKNKNIELFGKENDQKIEKSIMETDFDKDEIIFFEFNCLRFFKSTIHKVMQAECYAKNQLEITGHLSLNDYYDYLGIERINGIDDYGETFGWSKSQMGENKLEFIYDREYPEDDVSYYIIKTNIEPTMDWYCF